MRLFPAEGGSARLGVQGDVTTPGCKSGTSALNLASGRVADTGVVLQRIARGIIQISIFFVLYEIDDLSF